MSLDLILQLTSLLLILLAGPLIVVLLFAQRGAL